MSSVPRTIIWTNWETDEDLAIPQPSHGEHYYDRFPPPHYIPGGPKWWHGKCHDCGVDGYHSKICPRPPKDPRCTYCGASGHTRRNCHKRKYMERILEAERLEAEENEQQPEKETESDSDDESLNAAIGDTVMKHFTEALENTGPDSAKTKNQEPSAEGAPNDAIAETEPGENAEGAEGTSNQSELMTQMMQSIQQLTLDLTKFQPNK